MFKKESGITLIALVITIIVLLILAGVTIAMIAGQNGILTRATTARSSSALGDAKDQVALMVSDEVSLFYETKYVNSETYANGETAAAAAEYALSQAASKSFTGVTASWDSTEKKLTLTYTADGTTAVGSIDASNGNLKWE